MQRMETSHQPQIPALKLFEPSLAAAEDWELGKILEKSSGKWAHPGRVLGTAGETPRCSTSEKFRGTQNIPQEARGICGSVEPA